ncbi:MAG: heavy metal-responsive transcriptional regulator [Chloroflexi bacterium]|nr:heavy metal-responsive transcriptional regulator [Chloroflexota bacterium]
MLIRDLAKMTGVPSKTIRYYEMEGLLPPPSRAANGYRCYSEADVDRLRFIASARSLGFSLADIAEVLAFRDRGEAPCLYLLDLIAQKSAEIRQRIDDLLRLESELVDLQQQARNLPTDDVEGKACICHLVKNRTLEPRKEVTDGR